MFTSRAWTGVWSTLRVIVMARSRIKASLGL
jgi:hypothetical protein